LSLGIPEDPGLSETFGTAQDAQAAPGVLAFGPRISLNERRIQVPRLEALSRANLLLLTGSVVVDQSQDLTLKSKRSRRRSRVQVRPGHSSNDLTECRTLQGTSQHRGPISH
ncbi:MAG: hypothetical protein KDD62_12740, partial [Bdellovibrionales bacterium]|nr:hypothetical protein [Bdellovibrionales bacterium]